MDVADVGAEVFDGRVGGFAVVAVGMVHIPERAQLVARERVQERTQAGRIGKHAAGLEEDRHAQRFRRRDEHFECGTDVRVVVMQRRDGDIWRLDVVRGLQERLHRLGAVRPGNVAGGIEAGDAQPGLPQLARRRRRVILVQRAAAIGQRGRILDIIEFYAAEAHRLRHADLVFPRDILPAAGGK